jgi:hypothetical protein
MGGKGSEGIINLRRNPPLIPSIFLMVQTVRGCILQGISEGMELTRRRRKQVQVEGRIGAKALCKKIV